MEALYLKLLEYLPILPTNAGVGDTLLEMCWRYAAWALQIMVTTLAGTGEAMYNILASSNGSGSNVYGGASFIATALADLMNATEQNVVPAMAGLGIAIAVTFWLMGFIEMVAEDRMSPEMFAKHFAKLAIAVGLCMYAQELVGAVRAFGDAFTTMVMQAGLGLSLDNLGQGVDNIQNLTTEELAIQLMNNNEDMNFILVILAVQSMAMPIYIVSLVMICVCYIIQVTRILELAVRGAFLPVALGLLADDGWRGAGGRYIKKFIAICAQGGVLIFIGQATQYLMTYGLRAITVDGNIFGLFQSFVLSIAVGIACISVMFKSIGFVNDIFGA